MDGVLYVYNFFFRIWNKESPAANILKNNLKYFKNWYCTERFIYLRYQIQTKGNLDPLL